MKSRFFAFLVLAAATVASCSQDDTTDPVPAGREMNLSFTSDKPALDNDTRTVFENGGVLWNTTGEKIRIAYADNGAFAPSQTFYATDAATVSPDRRQATFSFTGTIPTDPGSYTFHALYPSTASSMTKLDYGSEISAKILNTQTPSATSFDPAADVMVAASRDTYTTISDQTTIPLLYKRLVAHGCVTLTGLAFEAGEKINSVTFTAPAATKIAGSVNIDLLQKQVTQTTEAVNALTLAYNAAALDAQGAFDAWFCSLPFDIASGEEFKIEVATPRGTYTRTITARAEGIRFLQNRYNTLTVDMSSATFEAAETLGGNYVILAPYKGAYYALSRTPSDTRLSAVEVAYTEGAESYATEDNTIVWNASMTGDNYTLDSEGNYLKWTTGNAASTTTEPYELKLAKQADGSYRINSAATILRSLRYNTSSNFYAFYTSDPSATMIGDLLFVRADITPNPKILLSQSTLTLEYDDETTHEIGVTLKNIAATDVISTATYEGEQGTTASDWLIGDYNATSGKIELFASANNTGATRKARIEMSATTAYGTATATLLVTQKIAGAPEIWTKVATLADITAGTYYIAALSEGIYYTVPETTISGQTFTCLEGTLEGDNLVAATGTGEFEFIAAQGINNAYYIRNKQLGKFLAATGSKAFGYVEQGTSNYGYWTISKVSGGGFSAVYSVKHGSKTHYMRAFNATIRCYDGANNQGFYLFKSN